MAEHKCEKCDREFQSPEALNMHNNSKHYESVKKPLFNKKKSLKWLWILGAVVLIIWGFNAIDLSSKTLPPTDMKGHIEQNPVNHILKEPMKIVIFKHMLEHADSVEGGKPGAIISYDCINYQCDADLIAKLEQFAVKYPQHVYVAPFKDMKNKIALTKLHQQKVLDEYNEAVIDAFVK